MKKKLIRIATRQSQLALWQANFVKSKLQNHYPDLQIELLPMLTQGDKNLETSLQKIGGKGLFVKELEKALLNRDADIAVHSMKDVPMEISDEFVIGAICEREDARDVFVSEKFEKLADLPKGAVLGTSSLRRAAQILSHYPELTMESLRGNVNTRLQKVRDGAFDAIILAAAGVLRLGLKDRIKSFMDVEFCLPAVGQGALGLECRSEDKETLALIAVLNHHTTNICVSAERAMNKSLHGSCQVPVAGYATLHNDVLRLQGLVATPNGSIILRAEAQGSAESPIQLGEEVAALLKDQGAEEVLKVCT